MRASDHDFLSSVIRDLEEILTACRARNATTLSNDNQRPDEANLLRLLAEAISELEGLRGSHERE